MVRSIQISSLKILDPNRHNLGESDRALAVVLGLVDGVVEPLLAVGVDPGEDGVGDGWRCAHRHANPRIRQSQNLQKMTLPQL